jgi:hypothetical protein
VRGDTAQAADNQNPHFALQGENSENKMHPGGMLE